MGLTLTRMDGQRLFIGADIVVTLVETRSGSAKLSIEAPREVRIMLEELLRPDWVIVVDAVNGPCWVATGDGDPARTHDIEQAERYATEREAVENAKAFRARFPARKFTVVRDEIGGV